ncbi:MAG: hypothetical protein ABI658_23255 [Acidimicrobiales bacterium]
MTTLQELSDAVDRLVITNPNELASVFRAIRMIDEKIESGLREFDREQRYLLSNASSTEDFLVRSLGFLPEDAAATMKAARRPLR